MTLNPRQSTGSWSVSVVVVWVRDVLQFSGRRGVKVLDPLHSKDRWRALRRSAPDQLGQCCSYRHVQGSVQGGVKGLFREGDPCRLSSPSAAMVPQALHNWSASHLPPAVRGPARGPRPRWLFHHGLTVVLADGNFLPFSTFWLLNSHLGFTFPL
jgi:hypothetical protein